MDTFAALATSTYATTTSFGSDAVATWTHDVLQLYVGIVFAFLDKDTSVLIAMTVIVAIVSFAFWGLHFFRH